MSLHLTSHTWATTLCQTTESSELCKLQAELRRRDSEVENLEKNVEVAAAEVAMLKCE